MDCDLYAFGPFELNIAQRRLLRSGEPVAITPKAFDVLLLLVQNQGRLVEKKTLMRSVWPDAFVEEGNVCVTISLLRKALGAGTKYIETVSKHGYRFVAEVRVVRLNNRAIEAHGAASIDVAPATLSPAVLCNESKTGGIRPKVLPIKGRVRIAICTLVLVLAFLGASLWLRTAIVAHAIKTSEVRSTAV